MKMTLLAVFTLVALALAVPAKATDTDFLNFTNGSIGKLCPAGGCASVTVTVTSSTSVTLTVTSLLNGFQFDTFGFNTSGTITSFSSSGAVNSADSHYGLDLSGGQQDGFGDFGFLFGTGVNGGSTGGNCTGNPGSPSAGCTFNLVLNGTGLTEASFESLSGGGAGDGYAEFAGHLASGTCTGYVGGGDVTGETNSNGAITCAPPSVVPEPSSLVLFGGGLLGLAAFIRRRPNLWATLWTARA